MSKHPYLQRHAATPGRLFALSVAFAFLAVAVLLMMANSVGESVPTPVTPATAGPAVEYEP